MQRPGHVGTDSSGTGTRVGQGWRRRSRGGGGLVPCALQPQTGGHGCGGMRGGQRCLWGPLSYSLVSCQGAEASCEIALARAQHSPEGLCLSSMTNPIR